VITCWNCGSDQITRTSMVGLYVHCGTCGTTWAPQPNISSPASQLPVQYPTPDTICVLCGKERSDHYDGLGWEADDGLYCTTDESSPMFSTRRLKAVWTRDADKHLENDLKLRRWPQLGEQFELAQERPHAFAVTPWPPQWMKWP
jgi:hypothetical protein